jgi:hypothetical protein
MFSGRFDGVRFGRSMLSVAARRLRAPTDKAAIRPRLTQLRDERIHQVLRNAL